MKQHQVMTTSLASLTAVLTACSADFPDDRGGPVEQSADRLGERTPGLTVPEGAVYRLRVAQSGKCMNVSGASQNDQASVIQWPCSANATNDQWDLVNVDADIYQIRALHSGKCLNVSGASTRDGAALIQFRCEGADNERFRVQRVSGGFRLRSVRSDKCVDVPNGSTSDGVQLVQWSCNGGQNQTFALAQSGAVTVGDPIPGLSSADVEAFEDGRADFEEIEEVEDGLGPIFNETGCGNCHNVGATGGGSEVVETRFGRETQSGSRRNRRTVFDPLAELGGSLRQDFTIGTVVVNDRTCEFPLEQVPAEANRVGLRRSTPLFGLGLVDALPDSTFTSLASSQPSRTRGSTSRTTNFVSGNTNAVGRFGWKGQNPTLFQFSGDAYLFEMGITNSLAPGIAPFGVEQCPNDVPNCEFMLACDPVPGIDDEDENPEDGVSDGVVAFFNFMKALTPPPRGPVGSAEIAGERVFNDVGCPTCHVSSFTTPNSNSLAPAVRSRTFHPYSDFLLHDMGDGADGIEQGTARTTQMRTAPLWGLRFITTFLHDGSAHSIEDAIRAHQGQGADAARAVGRLRQNDRANLIAFLRSL